MPTKKPYVYPTDAEGFARHAKKEAGWGWVRESGESAKKFWDDLADQLAALPPDWTEEELLAHFEDMRHECMTSPYESAHASRQYWCDLVQKWIRKTAARAAVQKRAS